MTMRVVPHLNRKKKYLQVALNSTLDEAYRIIRQLPRSDRIIVEAGTPLIKRYGEEGIRQIYTWYQAHLGGTAGLETESVSTPVMFGELTSAFFVPGGLRALAEKANKKAIVQKTAKKGAVVPYVVADLKTMDRGQTEVEMAARAGASAAVALGSAPIETLDSFIEQCGQCGLDAMIDMMNVEFPLAVLRKLKKVPPVVIIHRGVDEEAFNREKQIPFYEIQRIKGNYDILVSIAGGDTSREIQRAAFNDADIVVVWKSVYQSTDETVSLVESFLKEIK